MLFNETNICCWHRQVQTGSRRVEKTEETSGSVTAPGRFTAHTPLGRRRRRRRPPPTLSHSRHIDMRGVTSAGCVRGPTRADRSPLKKHK